MICTTFDGTVITECDHEVACTLGEEGSNIQKYEIDWDAPTTFQNFMTDLNLICTNHQIIGLMGSISFISFALGSALITRCADTAGRRKVVMYSSMVTPLGLIVLCLFKNVYTVYTVLFLIALTYNSRGSTAYMQGREFLPKKHHMAYISIQFVIVGINMVCTAVFFRYEKHQDHYFWVIIGIMALAIMWTAYAPDSPYFLLKSRNFEGLEQCFQMMMRINGRADDLKVTKIIQKLKEANPEPNPEHMATPKEGETWTSSVTRKNLAAVCYIWSQSGFAVYLLLFYVKFMPGDFFINYSVSGISDGLSMVYVALLSKMMGMKGILNFITTVQILLCVGLHFAIISETQIVALMPIIIVFLRLQCSALSTYAYEINNQLFPVLMRASVFGISNFVSRPLSSLGPYAAELTTHPEFLIIASSLMLYVAISMIKKYDFE